MYHIVRLNCQCLCKNNVVPRNDWFILYFEHLEFVQTKSQVKKKIEILCLYVCCMHWLCVPVCAHGEDVRCLL